MQHALRCFVRLVRLILGPDSVSDDKTACGSTLCVLGVDITISNKGFRCRPSRDKAERWRNMIVEALECDKLRPGDASKLAGRLSWACSQLFRKFGRAMLRVLFDQRTRHDGTVSPELRRALKWWSKVRFLLQACARVVSWVFVLGSSVRHCRTARVGCTC